MDIKVTTRTVWRFINKYKFVCVIILIGLMLMLIPETSENKPRKSEDTAIASNTESIDQKLEALLSVVDGAGEVRVLLTTLSGEETVYKTDDRGNDENINTSTVIVTDSNRNQSGLVKQKNPPVYRGAIIVCSGANDPGVRLALTDAVRNATGLRSNQISVLKMK